jgi:hypothetical protein
MLSYYVVYILAERTSLNWFTCTVESENVVTCFNVSFLIQVEVLNFFGGNQVEILNLIELVPLINKDTNTAPSCKELDAPSLRERGGELDNLKA